MLFRSPDGSIPEIPLEVYNFIIDLGSFRQKQYDANDVRSINNFNTLLPGTLQKYTCQSGVFRLAARDLPGQDAAAYEEAIARGLLLSQGDRLVVPTEPKDMRKPWARSSTPAWGCCKAARVSKKGFRFSGSLFVFHSFAAGYSLQSRR